MKITKSQLKQLIKEELGEIQEQAGSIENDLMHMLNDAKALGQKMDAVKKKMYKTKKWNRAAANLAGDVYAAQRAIEEYLQQQ